MSESTPKGHAMKSNDAIIATLIADDLMPANLVDTAWTVPEGMDCPWDNLDALLAHVEPVAAEWFGGVGGLRLTFVDAEEGETIIESFQPTP